MIPHTLDIIRKSHRVVIVSHIRPDGDAVGSQIALGWYLEKMGKTVSMLSSDPPPKNMEWLTGKKTVRVYTGSIKQRETIARADLIIIVDTNALDRLGTLSTPIRDSPASKILIDHHPGREDWFTHVFVREAASSTGELIYELFKAHDPDMIDRTIAQALYAAIMTDTGSFQFNSVTPHVHRIVADLLEIGEFNPEPIHNAIFNVRSLNGLRLLGRALETIQLMHGGKLGYMTVYESMVHEARANFDEMEGFVNYVLSIEGVMVAVIFLETERGVKMSFRSKDEYSVTSWANQFGGGGHRNASGAYVEGRRLDEVLGEVMAASNQHLSFGSERQRSEQPAALTGDDEALLSEFRK